jgi:HEPN domain-containing protein
MDDAKGDLVRAWLLRASHDLASARKLAAGDDPLLDTAIYHCQQAAEKTLKALLVFRDQRFPKTHDLALLLKLAVVVEPRIGAPLSDPDRLTEYGTAFRYPGDAIAPDRAEFERALADAEAVYRLALSLIPAAAHPV